MGTFVGFCDMQYILFCDYLMHAVVNNININLKYYLAALGGDWSSLVPLE